VVKKFDSERTCPKHAFMRPSQRKASKPRRRAAAVEARLSVSGAAGALRRGREALSVIQTQLDALLEALDDPSKLDARVPDRLAGATREAGAAIAQLSTLHALF
jgi:hypothetical protein